MNLILTTAGIPAALAMTYLSLCGLIRAERVGRCARPFVLPVFAGVAVLIMFGLRVHDLQVSDRTPRDITSALHLIIIALLFAVILLVIPHLRRRGR